MSDYRDEYPETCADLDRWGLWYVSLQSTHLGYPRVCPSVPNLPTHDEDDLPQSIGEDELHRRSAGWDDDFGLRVERWVGMACDRPQRDLIVQVFAERRSISEMARHRDKQRRTIREEIGRAVARIDLFRALESHRKKSA